PPVRSSVVPRRGRATTSGTERTPEKSRFSQAEDGIREWSVTGVQTCALPIWQIVHHLMAHHPGTVDQERTAVSHSAIGFHIVSLADFMLGIRHQREAHLT